MCKRPFWGWNMTTTHALFIQIIISMTRAEKTHIYGSGHENEKYQRNTHILNFGISMNRFGIPIPKRFGADTESEFGTLKKNIYIYIFLLISVSVSDLNR